MSDIINAPITIPADIEISVGPTGPTGATGPEGPIGPTGPAGADGSPYAVLYTAQTLTDAQQLQGRDNLGAGKERVFNVEDYGAVGDDATDNTVAINEAIRAANVAGGGIVFIPSGTYQLQLPPVNFYAGYTVAAGGSGDPCLLLLAGVDLVGDGAAKTILKLPFAHTSGLPALLQVVAQNNFEIRGLTFLGNNPGGTTFISGENTAIDLQDSCRLWTIKDCVIKNFANEGIDHDILAGDSPTVSLDGYGNLLQNVRFEDIGGSGMHGASGIIIERCHFKNVGVQRYNGAIAGEPGTSGSGAIDGTGHKTIARDCEFYDCSRAWHIYVAPSGGVVRENSSFINCRVENTLGLALEVLAGTLDLVSGCYSEGGNPTLRGNRVFNSTIINDQSVAANYTIPVGIVFENCTLSYMSLVVTTSALPCRIVGNNLTTNLTGSSINLGNNIDNVLIDGNTITQLDSGLASGVAIGTNSPNTQTNIRITNNYTTGGSRGARIKSNSIVSGNVFIGTLQESIRIDTDNNIVASNIVSTVSVNSGSNNTIANEILAP